MNKFPIRYRVELSSDSIYANIYSQTGKLAACFYMRNEQGKAVLYDKVTNSLSIIPAEDEVILVSPFMYNEETDTLSTAFVLKNNESVMFESSVSDLMSAKSFQTHYPSCTPPPTKPCHNPILDRFATYDELNSERAMRKHGDEHILEILGVNEKQSKSFADKIHILESDSIKNSKKNCEQEKKLTEIDGKMNNLKFDVKKNLSDFKKELTEESEKRTVGQNKLFDSYSSVQRQTDDNTSHIISINDSLTKNREHLMQVERDLHCEIEREGKKHCNTIKNLHECLHIEKDERKDADNDLLEKIESEHRFTMRARQEFEEGLLQERQISTAKNDELEKRLINKLQPKGNYVEYICSDGKKYIKIPYEGSIMGEMEDGSITNILNIDANGVNVGSSTMPLTVSSSEERPSYNGNDSLALLSDVEDSYDNLNAQISVNKEDIEARIFQLEHELYHYQEKTNIQLNALAELVQHLQEQIDCINEKIGNKG